MYKLVAPNVPPFFRFDDGPDNDIFNPSGVSQFGQYIAAIADVNYFLANLVLLFKKPEEICAEGAAVIAPKRVPKS
jgi:hypothetical protein